MIKQKQLFKHNPTATYGDCQRTVIACLLNKRPEEVPNFGIHYGDVPRFFAEMKAYLRSQGYAMVTFHFDCLLSDLLMAMGATNPDSYYMLGGSSKNGCNNVVIGLGSEIVWDTAIDNSGIVGPADNDHYSVDFLVPIGLTTGEA